MENLKLIIADNLKIEFHKVKGDYIIGLVTKSLVNKKNIGSRPPKVGLKAAEVKHGSKIVIYEYTGTKHGWVKLNEFSPTEIKTYPQKILYKTQRYFHKDIITSKSHCELFFDNDVSYIFSPIEALSFIFDGNVPPIVNDAVNSTEKALFFEGVYEDCPY